MAGYAAQDEEVRQGIDHVDAFQPTRDADGQAFVGELADDVEHPEPPSVVGAIFDEVVGPHDCDAKAAAGSPLGRGIVSKPIYLKRAA